ncbi:MAG: hypothetical protein M1438_17610 [Deltaproteobacteria bacterium]|nr:hypothetical protein [Deltaproteobacteria bacterium]
MIRRSKFFLILILAGSFLLAGAYVSAQAPPATGGPGKMAPPASPEAAKQPPYSAPYPMGFVSIELKQIAAGVGVEWGSGLLTYKGKQYTFKVKGLQIGSVGISKLTAKGEVYNLFQLAEFPGQYAAVEAGGAIIKGKEKNDFKNAKGVHIVFTGTQKGLNLTIGPAGFTVRMEAAMQ